MWPSGLTTTVLAWKMLLGFRSWMQGQAHQAGTCLGEVAARHVVSGKAWGEASPSPLVEKEQQEGTDLEEKVHCIVLGAEIGARFAYWAGGTFRRCVASWWDMPMSNIIGALQSLGNAGWMLKMEVFSLLAFVLLLSEFVWRALSHTATMEHPAGMVSTTQQAGTGGRWWILMLMQVEVQRSEA